MILLMDVSNTTSINISDNNILNTVITFGTNNIRVYGTSNEPWFYGKDVATTLDYKDTINAIKTHIKSEDKKYLNEILIDGKPPATTYNELNSIYINESGLYTLILRSNLPIAKQFKDWVTSKIWIN
jgi:anti-repressor protein